MQNNYYSIYPYINIYERPSVNSKISSQIIYGEKFRVLKKVKNFLKIKTYYDNYNGYIKERKFAKNSKPTHKVKVFADTATEGEELLYTHDFGTMKVAKAIARSIGVPVVKFIRTQVTYYNVDGSKRGYGKEKHIGVL